MFWICFSLLLLATGCSVSGGKPTGSLPSPGTSISASLTPAAKSQNEGNGDQNAQKGDILQAGTSQNGLTIAPTVQISLLPTINPSGLPYIASPTPKPTPVYVPPSPTPTPSPCVSPCHQASAILPPPTGLISSSDVIPQGAHFTVSWNAVNGAVSYNLYVENRGSETNTNKFFNLTETSKELDGSWPDTYFYVQVSTVDAKGTESVKSPVLTVYVSTKCIGSSCFYNEPSRPPG